MKLIDKDALVAMVEERMQLIRPKNDSKVRVADVPTHIEQGWLNALTWVKDSINTLEVKGVPIWEKVSPDTGQTTLYKDGGKSYLERFGYRIDLKDLDKLPKNNLKAQKGE